MTNTMKRSEFASEANIFFGQQFQINVKKNDITKCKLVFSCVSSPIKHHKHFPRFTEFNKPVAKCIIFLSGCCIRQHLHPHSDLDSQCLCPCGKPSTQSAVPDISPPTLHINLACCVPFKPDARVRFNYAQGNHIYLEISNLRHNNTAAKVVIVVVEHVIGCLGHSTTIRIFKSFLINKLQGINIMLVQLPGSTFNHGQANTNVRVQATVIQHFNHAWVWLFRVQ